MAFEFVDFARIRGAMETDGETVSALGFNSDD
jgi:hypothetical protein